MATAPKISARLAEFSDREFLQIVADLQDNNGWTETESIAYRIFPTEMGNGQTLDAIRSVSIRMSWMRRFGVIEYGGIKSWGLTREGMMFAKGKLPQAIESKISNLSEKDLLEVTHVLSGRLRGSNPVAAKMMRREWRYNELQLRK